MNMQYEYHHLANTKFDHIDDRVGRELAAEQWLIQKFLNAATQPGWFVEVGANHPTEGSQTVELEQMEWHGLLVEPQPDLAELCKENRPGSIIANVACGPPGGPRTRKLQIASHDNGHATIAKETLSVNPVVNRHDLITVDMCTLDELLEEHAPPTIDFISIDVEGFMTKVLDGFTVKRWRPRLLLVEDDLINFSIMRHRSLREAGYRLAKRTLVNNWYVPSESLSSVPITPAERLKLRLKVARTPTRLFSNKIRDFSRGMRGRS